MIVSVGGIVSRVAVEQSWLVTRRRSRNNVVDVRKVTHVVDIMLFVGCEFPKYGLFFSKMLFFFPAGCHSP